MGRLDLQTSVLVAELHAAWTHDASIATYAKLRDRLLEEGKHVETRITTLSAVVRVACPWLNDGANCSEGPWGDLFKIADDIDHQSDTTRPGKRKRSADELTRLRNLALVSALWSPSVVSHYQWDTAARKHMKLLRAGALRFPRFEDFCQRLNFVLLYRHCEAIRTGRRKTLGQAPMQPHSDLNMTALSSVSMDWDLLAAWTTTRDTSAMLVCSGSMSLRDCRPHHSDLYLLKVDLYGMLVAQDDTLTRLHARPSHTGSEVTAEQSSESGEEQHSSVAWERFLDDTVTVEMPSGIFSPSQVTETDETPATTQDSDSSAGAVNTPCERLSSPDTMQEDGVEKVAQDSTLTAHRTIAATAGVFPTYVAVEYQQDGAENGTFCASSAFVSLSDLEIVSDGREASLQTSSMPMAHGILESRQNSTSQPTRFASYTSQSSPEQVTDADHDELCRNNEWIGNASQANKAQLDGNILTSSALESRDQELVWLQCPMVRELGSAANQDFQTEMNHHDESTSSELQQSLHLRKATGMTSLAVGDPVVSSAQRLRPEEIQHNKHHKFLSTYTEMLSRAAETEQAGSPRWTRAQWLKPTTNWAKIWTPLDERSESENRLAERDADVLFYTSDDFILASKSGRTFSQPVVLKETFSDADMHDTHSFASILQGHIRDSKVQIKSLESERIEVIDLQTFAQLLERHDESDMGLHTVHLRDFARSHRPVFTLLGRFRLMDCLLERVHFLRGKQAEPFAAEPASCVTSNILAMPGAFMGAQLHAMGGRWTRNLQGMALLMIVPDYAMESQWEIFVKAGRDWIPNGRERLVVLEKNDVLFIPPGLSVVHAVHFPTTGLTQEGLIWDDLTIIPTLKVLSWGAEQQRDMSRDVIHWLLPIVRELELLVMEPVEQLRSDIQSEEFKDAAAATVRCLDKLLSRLNARKELL